MMNVQQVRSEISRLEQLEKSAAQEGKAAVMGNSERKRLIKERRDLKRDGKDVAGVSARLDELEAGLLKPSSATRAGARDKMATMQAMLAILEAPGDRTLAQIDAEVAAAAARVEAERVMLSKLAREREAFLAASAVRDLPPMQRAVLELQSIASAEKFGKLGTSGKK